MNDDANWFSLEQSIKDGNVVPIIGPDALLVEFEGETGGKRDVPFYRLVAADLLKSFQVEPPSDLLEHTWVLHEAVTAILANASGRGIEQRIRREVSRLATHHCERARPAESLCRLARIPAFTLFISLTPDNLLERALGPTEGIHVRSYSPRDASESLADLPSMRRGERGIFQILGSCATVGGGYAMHEEDALEYLYRLQSDAGRRFSSTLSQLRRRDKLFIGCNFPDWLGRAMLRLVNDNRLYAKDTQDFLCPDARDAALHAFLTQYSPNTLGFDGELGDLAGRLAQSFGAAAPPPAPKAPLLNPGGPTVFVSYAGENAEPARRIADTLLILGFSDVWLDKKKLIGGDDWSDRIDEAIEKTDFFIPLLSREADGRREGVFWDEWETALKRSRRIKDAYLLPVVIDAEPPSKGSYRRISDGDTAVFFDKHLIHAPGGVLQAEDREALKERCRRFLEASHG